MKNENDAESPKTADDLVSLNENKSPDAPDKKKMKLKLMLLLHNLILIQMMLVLMFQKKTSNHP